MLVIDVLKASQEATELIYGADADWVHIGATWQIRLNRLRAAEMRLCEISLTTYYYCNLIIYSERWFIVTRNLCSVPVP